MEALSAALGSMWVPDMLPGINTIITGASQAAGQLGWEIVGIRDGFEGLLHPDRYPEGGLIYPQPAIGCTP